MKLHKLVRKLINGSLLVKKSSFWKKKGWKRCGNLKIWAWCFPKVFTVELCHVIAIFQVTSNLLPPHAAHLCLSPVYYQFKCVLIFHHIGGKPLSSVLFQSAIVGRSFTRAMGVGRSAGSCGRNRLTRCGTPGKSRRGEEDHDQPPWEELLYGNNVPCKMP